MGREKERKRERKRQRERERVRERASLRADGRHNGGAVNAHEADVLKFLATAGTPLTLNPKP